MDVVIENSTRSWVADHTIETPIQGREDVYETPIYDQLDRFIGNVLQRHVGLTTTMKEYKLQGWDGINCSSVHDKSFEVNERVMHAVGFSRVLKESEGSDSLSSPSLIERYAQITNGINPYLAKRIFPMVYSAYGSVPTIEFGGNGRIYRDFKNDVYTASRIVPHTSLHLIESRPEYMYRLHEQSGASLPKSLILEYIRQRERLALFPYLEKIPKLYEIPFSEIEKWLERNLQLDVRSKEDEEALAAYEELKSKNITAETVEQEQISLAAYLKVQTFTSPMTYIMLAGTSNSFDTFSTRCSALFLGYCHSLNSFPDLTKPQVRGAVFDIFAPMLTASSQRTLDYGQSWGADQEKMKVFEEKKRAKLLQVAQEVREVLTQN